MATAGTSGQTGFGLGRRKKNPGVLDQIGKFFGGDKKRKGKGSFRGLSSSPQRPTHSSPRRGGENAVVHFFRTIVSPAPPKSRVSIAHLNAPWADVHLNLHTSFRDHRLSLSVSSYYSLLLLTQTILFPRPCLSSRPVARTHRKARPGRWSKPWLKDSSNLISVGATNKLHKCQ
uniref:Myelin basic protein n=1 Tax=Denticeps clupeoides TaxID=299321 RepID=A0AAY4EGT9_9TELE